MQHTTLPRSGSSIGKKEVNDAITFAHPAYAFPIKFISLRWFSVSENPEVPGTRCDETVDNRPFSPLANLPSRGAALHDGGNEAEYHVIERESSWACVGGQEYIHCRETVGLVRVS